MPLTSIKHSTTAYRADAHLYGIAVLCLSAWLLLHAPADMALLAWMAAGLLGWSAVEYMLHRFVLHGLPPFSRWHREHHLRPAALIRMPTWLSALMIGVLVFLPGVWFLGQWPGSALTLGFLVGYLANGVVHHAMHHSSTDNRWLQERKYWHARHHHSQQPCCYGVTSRFWDRVWHTTSHRKQARANVPVRRVNG